MSPEGEVVSFSFKLVFDCTNNVAEYSALLIGLELAILAGIRNHWCSITNIGPGR